MVQCGSEVFRRVAEQLLRKYEDDGRAFCSDSDLRERTSDIVSDNVRLLTPIGLEYLRLTLTELTFSQTSWSHMCETLGNTQVADVSRFGNLRIESSRTSVVRRVELSWFGAEA
jgi:hypothetical protein